MLSSIGLTSSDIIQEALALGVIDFVTKPDNSQSLTAIRKELIEKVKGAAAVDRFRLLEYRSMQPAKKQPTGKFKTHQVVVVVTSAGGPPSLYEVISKFSDSFYAGVVVAQHIPSSFVPSFVSHIQKMTPMPVSIAEKGALLFSRRVLFSPTHCTLMMHQTKKGAVVDLVDLKTRLQPDIDSVITSCANVFKSNTILVVLSGLGNDGVKGAEVVKKVGGKVIVEDKSTAGLFSGMPQSVINSGFYDATCPSYGIAEMVESYFNEKHINLQQKKFLVKGLVIRNTINYIRTKCLPAVYAEVIAAIPEASRSVANSTLSPYNYYPGTVYEDLCAALKAKQPNTDKSTLEDIAYENGRESFRLYKQGFPLNNIEHFIKFIPTFHKIIFPGTAWEIISFSPESHLLVFRQISDEYNERSVQLLQQSIPGWIRALLEEMRITHETCQCEIGNENGLWFIKGTIRWE